MDVSYLDPAVAAFVIIPLVLAGVLAWGTAVAWRRSGAGTREVRRATAVTGGAAALWLAVSWALAARGTLRDWSSTPPPFALFVAAILALSAAIAFSPLGRRLARFLPLWTLVAVQGFRLPLELAMHGMYERGIMPEQMSYSGRNFDIVTGSTAIVVAALLATGRAGRGLVAAWNVLGLSLLINVVIVAFLSTPVFRFFGDDRLNVWITYPPFVWLPAILVLAAFAGHFVVFRAILRSDRAPMQAPASRRTAI